MGLIMENKPKYEIDGYGTKRWYLNDELHREDGPAVEYSDGTKRWFINGKQHRLDGPAVELCSGTKRWFINGKQHRLDGPAVIYCNSKVGWWVNGKNITEHVTYWAKENDIDLDNLSEDDKLLIKLIWADYDGK